MRMWPYSVMSILLLVISVITNAIIIIPGVAHSTPNDYYTIITISVLITIFGMYAFLAAGKLASTIMTFTKEIGFRYDFNLISAIMILVTFILLLVQRNNFEIQGWWLLLVYLMPLYGIVFGFLYAVIALMMKSHRRYTNIFAAILLVVYILRAYAGQGIYSNEMIMQIPYFDVIYYYTSPLLVFFLIVHIIASIICWIKCAAGKR